MKYYIKTKISHTLMKFKGGSQTPNNRNKRQEIIGKVHKPSVQHTKCSQRII